MAVEMAGWMEEREVEKEVDRRERGVWGCDGEGEVSEEMQTEGKRVALHVRRIGRGTEGSGWKGDGWELAAIGVGLGMAWSLNEAPRVERK